MQNGDGERAKAEIPLAQAAWRLRVRSGVARDAVLRGILDGRQNATGRWFVTVESVEREIARRAEQAAQEPSQAAQAL
jgi:hypothetical protein